MIFFRISWEMEIDETLYSKMYGVFTENVWGNHKTFKNTHTILVTT
jgi:hypothetical protein